MNSSDPKNWKRVETRGVVRIHFYRDALIRKAVLRRFAVQSATLLMRFTRRWNWTEANCRFHGAGKD